MKKDEPDTEDQYKKLRKDESTKTKKEERNPNADNYEFYINPQIDQTYKKSIQKEEEGCLSIPDVRIIAERFDKINSYFSNINIL